MLGETILRRLKLFFYSLYAPHVLYYSQQSNPSNLSNVVANASIQCSENFVSSIKSTFAEDNARWIVTAQSLDLNETLISGWNIVFVEAEETEKRSLAKVYHVRPQRRRFGKLKARKIDAYIYAIRKEAKLIYMNSEDVHFADHKVLFFNYSDRGGGLVYYERNFGVSGELFDPYTFYEGLLMYSRSETISMGHFNKSITLLLCRKLPAAAIQEGVIIEKGRIVAPLIIAIGTYSLWIPKHTLYHYNSFFVLPILNVASSRKETFVLSLLAQKLLHLVGTSLAFYPIESDKGSGITVARNTDLIDLSDYLRSWRCSRNQLPDCMMLLIRELVDKGYLSEDWLSLISYWIQELHKILYRFPSVYEEDSDCLYTLDETSRRQNCRRSSIYFPNFSAANMNKLNKWRKETFDGLSKWCAKAEYCGTTYNGSTGSDFSRVYETTLETRLSNVLIIIDNHQRKKGFGLLQRLYQPYFGMTIFCGSFSPLEYKDEGDFPDVIFPFNYIHISRIELVKGFFFHYCLSKVKDLNLKNVKGYFLAGDDAIFNFWHELNQSEILFPLVDGGKSNKNGWWLSNYGRKATEHASRIFEEMSKTNNNIRKILACYQEGLIESGFNEDALVHIARDTSKTLSDFFYVPQKRVAYMAEVIELFFEANMFVEIALLKILQTIPHIRLDPRRFSYIQYRYRPVWYELYDSEKIMVHPIKINQAAELRTRGRFCSTVVRAFREALIPQLRAC